MRPQEDGTIRQGGSIFAVIPHLRRAHGGQPLNLNEELPKPDLKKLRAYLARRPLTDRRIVEIREHARRVREASDRAVFFNNGAAQLPIGIGGFAGLAIFPILCITEPDMIAEYHELLTSHREGWFRALLPEIAPYVDVIMMAADDWGTQNTLIASPKVYRNLFLPYYRRVNDLVHELAPGVKTFLHSCGAIYDLIDLVIESGFDILNPVQWSAGKRSYRSGGPLAAVLRSGAASTLRVTPAPRHGRGRGPRGPQRSSVTPQPGRRLCLLQYPQHPGRDPAREGYRAVSANEEL